MQKETNMEVVRETAKVLLYISITKTKLSPLIIQHPFASTGFVMLKGQSGIIDITANEENLRRWRKQIEKEIDAAKDVNRINFLINNPYRLTFLKYARHGMSVKDFSSLLADAWIISEEPNRDLNVSKKELVEMFKSADKMELMDEEDRAVFSSLEDRVTIYRGVTPYNAKNVKALSWTLDEEKAEWFAFRYDEEGTVYKAEIKKEHILAYFGGRGESKVIVEPRYLENIQEWERSTLQQSLLQ